MLPHRLALRFAVVLVALAVAAASSAPTAPAAQAPASRRLATSDDQALYARLCAQADAGWDSARGGWVAKGSPDEDAIELALARGRDGDALAAARAARTLGWMHALLDTVGGGYMTGERDMDPRRTHFEKLTIPNARRLELLVLSGGTASASARRGDTRRVVDYFERVLVDPRGGFVTGQAGSRDLEPESNGISLQAWWRLGAATANPDRRAFARRSQARLWSECRHPELGFVRRNTFGVIREPSLLLDQVEVARAHLFAWSATGRDSELVLARMLAAEIREHFASPRGGFRVEYAAERFGHALRARRPFEDNARAARFFAELASATGDTSYASLARGAWGSMESSLGKSRQGIPEWALAVRALWAPDLPARARWEEEAPRKPATQPTRSRVTRIRHRR